MKSADYLNELKELDILLLRGMFLARRGIRVKKSPSPLQFKIFRYLKDNKKYTVSQTDLEKAFRVSRATISGALATMEKNGSIERVASKEDARVKTVRLTDKSLKAYQGMQKRTNELNKKIAEGIPEKDLETFLKVLGVMKSNLEAEIGKIPNLKRGKLC